MTSAELVQAFKFGMDKFDSFGLPNFEDDEIYLLLNQAQDRFVKQRYGDTNTKKFGFEEIQKRTEDIKNIVRNSIIVPSANTSENISTNSQFCTLPTDYWISVQERARITYLSCTGEVTPDECFVEAIHHNDYNYKIGNPYTKPNTGKILRLMENGKMELIHSPDTTITSLHLRYIKEPSRITDSVTCELSPMVHQEVVNEGIKIGLEGIEAEKRLQTFVPVIQNTQE